MATNGPGSQVSLCQGIDTVQGANVQIGLGFVGAGRQGREHLKQFARLPHASLSAVYDANAAQAEQAAAEFPSLEPAASLADLLARTDVAAVVVSTPAETHRLIAEACLAAGRHVLLEKPLAHTAVDARAIVAAAEARPELVVLAGHCERFNRAFIDVRKAIDEGRIGTPRFAWASRLSPWHLNDPAWPLGALDTAVHDIDILLWLLDDTPRSVAAQGTNVHLGGVFDQVVYQIQFAGGALAQGHIGWTEFGPGYPMRENAHPRLFLAGTAGHISVDLWRRPVSVHGSADGSYFWPDDVLVGYGDYFTEVTAQDFAFLEAVADRSRLPIAPREACRALEVAHAAHRSLVECGGAPLMLDNALQ